MRRLNTLWQHDSALQTLSAHAEHINALQKTWETAVPPSLKRHCRAGLISNQRLTVYATSGTVAAKLKLLSAGLVTKLQAQGLEVTAIRVEVQVKSEAREPAKPLRSLSKHASFSLEAFASSLTDSPLREVLRRLAKRRQS